MKSFQIDDVILQYITYGMGPENRKVLRCTVPYRTVLYCTVFGGWGKGCTVTTAAGHQTAQYDSQQ